MILSALLIIFIVVVALLIKLIYQHNSATGGAGGKTYFFKEYNNLLESFKNPSIIPIKFKPCELMDAGKDESDTTIYYFPQILSFYSTETHSFANHDIQVKLLQNFYNIILPDQNSCKHLSMVSEIFKNELDHIFEKRHNCFNSNKWRDFLLYANSITEPEDNFDYLRKLYLDEMKGIDEKPAEMDVHLYFYAYILFMCFDDKRLQERHLLKQLLLSKLIKTLNEQNPELINCSKCNEIVVYKTNIYEECSLILATVPPNPRVCYICSRIVPKSQELLSSTIVTLLLVNDFIQRLHNTFMYNLNINRANSMNLTMLKKITDSKVFTDFNVGGEFSKIDCMIFKKYILSYFYVIYQDIFNTEIDFLHFNVFYIYCLMNSPTPVSFISNYYRHIAKLRLQFIKYRDDPNQLYKALYDIHLYSEEKNSDLSNIHCDSIRIHRNTFLNYLPKNIDCEKVFNVDDFAKC